MDWIIGFRVKAENLTLFIIFPVLQNSCAHCWRHTGFMYGTKLVKIARFEFSVESLQRNLSYSRNGSLLFKYSAGYYWHIVSKITKFVANYRRFTWEFSWTSLYRKTI